MLGGDPEVSWKETSQEVIGEGNYSGWVLAEQHSACSGQRKNVIVLRHNLSGLCFFFIHFTLCQEPQNMVRNMREAGSLESTQSSFTSWFPFMGQGSWGGCVCPGGQSWVPFGVAVSVSSWVSPCLCHQAFGRADGDTEAWQRLQVKNGHLRVTAKLVRDGDPSAAVTGSTLLLVTERCFLYLLMCTCGASTGQQRSRDKNSLEQTPKQPHQSLKLTLFWARLD